MAKEKIEVASMRNKSNFCHKLIRRVLRGWEPQTLPLYILVSRMLIYVLNQS